MDAPVSNSFASAHPDIMWWVVVMLGGAVVALVMYIFNDRQNTNKNALSTLEINLTSAVNALKDSVNRLTNTVETLRDDVFGEIDIVKVETHKIDIRLKTVETTCKERAKHCPLYAQHIHNRPGEPLKIHTRHDDFADGSDDR
jgi:hypothetical protein